MRNNPPTTGIETHLHPHRPIVTRTDLQGKIQYANLEFVEISGYAESELLGRDHNIVRHPDMPAQAFADLWATIRRGQSWKGLVKNRRKDGGFYWVKAHVSPLFEQGRHVGYMSVRVAPSEAERQQAEQLYRSVRQGRVRFPATPSPAARPLWFWLLAMPLPLSLAAVGGLFVERAVALGLLAAGAALTGGGLFHLSRRIGRSCDAVREALAHWREGRLHLDIAPGGAREFHRLFAELESTRVSLQATIADVVLVNQRLEGASGQIRQEAGRLYERNDQVAQGVGQVTAAMEQLAASIEEISAMTSEGSGHVRRTRDLVEQGGRHSVDSQSAMDEAASQARQTNALVHELGGISERIGSVTDIIENIARQTNLLALNAAIEAARAGESGRGFAVVADEVRQLAEHTASNTDTIRTSIAALRDKIAQILDGRQAVGVCIGRVQDNIQQTVASLRQIDEACVGLGSVTGAIANALTQQSSASHEVACSMETLGAASGRITGHIAGNREVASALYELSSSLTKLLKPFENRQ